MKTRFSRTRPRTSDGIDHAVTVLSADSAAHTLRHLSYAERIAELEGRLNGLLPSSSMFKAVEAELFQLREEVRGKIAAQQSVGKPVVRVLHRPTPPSQVRATDWRKVNGKWVFGEQVEAKPTYKTERITERSYHRDIALGRLNGMVTHTNEALLATVTEAKDWRGNAR